MPFAPAMKLAMGLIAEAEALAAYGAALANPEPGPIADQIGAVTALLAPDALSDLKPAEATMIRSYIRSFLRQAMDLLENPGRPAGWAFDDPLILENIGQGSKQLVRMIEEIAVKTPALSERMARAGKFLDVGSGVGWISIEAARSWPAFAVEGIDIFDPALALAERNLAQSGLAERVSFRKLSIADLNIRDTYAAAFFAGPFIPTAIVPDALQRLHAAIEPGGWLFFGLFRAAPEPLPQALLKLRVLRSGGYPWTPPEVRTLLEAAGFVWHGDQPSDGPAYIVTARKT
jgi:SAM-dependent methyltransferase